jgi:hypothetical protein
MAGFPLEIRRQLFMAAGCICMKSGCQNKLAAPIEPGKLLIIGEGAHIISEATNGPRHTWLANYDTFENGIALCANCHREADNKQLLHTYTAERLIEWKCEAIKLAQLGIGKPFITGNFDRRAEWEIVDNFNKKISPLVNLLWSFTNGWEIPNEAFTLILIGSNGFIPLHSWGHRHPLRSVDSTYCFRQDEIIESLVSIKISLQKKYWHNFVDNPPDIMRFTPREFIATPDQQTENTSYAIEVSAGLAKFNHLARSFINSH